MGRPGSALDNAGDRGLGTQPWNSSCGAWSASPPRPLPGPRSPRGSRATTPPAGTRRCACSAHWPTSTPWRPGRSRPDYEPLLPPPRMRQCSAPPRSFLRGPAGPCGGCTWTGPALRRSHTRKRKGTKARSAHIRVSTGSRGTPRPCQLTPSLSILGASWERRSTGQLRSETVKRRKCSRLYTPDAQNARTRALDPLCSQLGPGCQVSRWYAPARGTVRADSNLAPGTAPSHVRTVRFKPFYLSPLTESNRRPSPSHGDALPTELRGHTAGRASSGRPDPV